MKERRDREGRGCDKSGAMPCFRSEERWRVRTREHGGIEMPESFGEDTGRWRGGVLSPLYPEKVGSKRG